jgi:hypothetical protein
LVGEELCLNPKYIDSVIEYSKSFLMSGFVWPVRPFGPLRDWAYWLFTWGLRRDINRCFKFLLPLIDERVEQKKSPNKSNQEEPLDMVQGKRPRLFAMRTGSCISPSPLRLFLAH